MEFGNFEHTCDGEDEHKRRRSKLDRLKAAMTNSTVLTRHEFVKRGEKLEYFTVAWNSLEGLVSIVAGVFSRFRFPDRVRPGQLDRGHVWSRLALAPSPRSRSIRA